MLSDHKKYLIRRNKKLLKELSEKISSGNGVRNSLKEVAEENGVSYDAAMKIYYKEEYAWSPYFEYDEDGNKIAKNKQFQL